MTLCTIPTAPTSLSARTGIEARRIIRAGEWSGHTSGTAPNHVQGNVAILPASLAGDFLRFCQRNPKPCPLLGVSEPGDPHLPGLGEDLDIRTDVPAYRIWRHGELVEEVTDIRDYWRDDLVTFVLGCSFSFESMFVEQGIPVRHIELGRTAPVYRTNIRCSPCGRFSGPLVVSMRPMLPAQAAIATTISARYPIAHGGPIHIGDPRAIGIARIEQPDYGDPPEIRKGEVPVFWACGVTPLEALIEAKPPVAITHKSGHMFVTDLKLTEFGSISAS